MAFGALLGGLSKVAGGIGGKLMGGAKALGKGTASYFSAGDVAGGMTQGAGESKEAFASRQDTATKQARYSRATDATAAVGTLAAALLSKPGYKYSYAEVYGKGGPKQRPKAPPAKRPTRLPSIAQARGSAPKSVAVPESLSARGTRQSRIRPTPERKRAQGGTVLT